MGLENGSERTSGSKEKSKRTKLLLVAWLTLPPYDHLKSQDSSVGMATGYGLGGWGSISSRGWTFLYSTTTRPALGPTQPPIQWLPGVLSPGVKRPEREAHHSRSSSTEVKNSGAVLSLPHTPP
jgi:hypothetical protein